MKKLLALAMAGMMCAVAAPIHAAEEAPVDPQTDGDQNIETEAATQEAKGQVWAMLSEKETLDQMKVTVPIRLHFAVLNKSTAADAADKDHLQFKTPHEGKYAISVDKTSSVDVKVNSVKVEKPQNGKWTLAPAATVADATDPRTVSINLMGQPMVQDTAVTITDFTVEKNTSKAIPFTGTASKGDIPASEDGKKSTGIYEKAFNVTYTLEMVTPTESAGE